MDRTSRRPLHARHRDADPRIVAAHDCLCEAGDLLEELHLEGNEERIRDAMLAIDMVRLYLKSK